MNRRDFFRGVGAAAVALAIEPVPVLLVPRLLAIPYGFNCRCRLVPLGIAVACEGPDADGLFDVTYEHVSTYSMPKLMVRL